MTQQAALKALASRAVGYKGAGGYDVIEVITREVRAPGDGEVRIKVAAAAVNPTDIMFRDPGMPGQTFPVVPGMEAAGLIEAIGPGVSRFAIGDRVMAVVMPRRPEGGAQAEHIVAPEASVVAAPGGVTLAEASTLLMNGLTALRALELAELRSGQWLAITGGAGQLARYAAAVAKRQGIRVIVDAKPDDLELVRSYGAELVIERGQSFSEAVRNKIPEGVDALLDPAVLGDAAFGAIRDGGVYLPVRGWGDEGAERDIAVRPVFVFQVLGRTDWLELLRDMAASGEIGLRVEHQFPPEEAADAQRALTAGGLRARPVIAFE